jgi:hypothetical protein
MGFLGKDRRYGAQHRVKNSFFGFTALLQHNAVNLVGVYQK